MSSGRGDATWSQIAEAEYLRLPLRAHLFLSAVPIYDVWRVDLPAREGGTTMLDVRASARAMADELPSPLAVRTLFAMRRWMGRLLSWDTPDTVAASSWRSRIDPVDISASLVPSGTRDGPFSVLYVHDTEAVSEIRNRTVHAFLVLALEPVPDGHALYFAIHVLPVSALTKPYLALIKPFRLWIVYPSLFRRFSEAWRRGLGRRAVE